MVSSTSTISPIVEGRPTGAGARLDQFLSLVEGRSHLGVDDSVRRWDEAGDESRWLAGPACACGAGGRPPIYIDEDNDVRVGYRNPYDGLSLSGLHADALSWAAEAKKMGEARTATKGGPLVASSHLTRLG